MSVFPESRIRTRDSGLGRDRKVGRRSLFLNEKRSSRNIFDSYVERGLITLDREIQIGKAGGVAEHETERSRRSVLGRSLVRRFSLPPPVRNRHIRSSRLESTNEGRTLSMTYPFEDKGSRRWGRVQ